MKEVLPTGAEGYWEEIIWVQDNNLRRINEEEKIIPLREGDALKKKIGRLYASKKPTGDPPCPEDVKMAKRIKYDILSKCEAIVEDSLEESNGSNDEKVLKWRN